MSTESAPASGATPSSQQVTRAEREAHRALARQFMPPLRSGRRHAAASVLQEMISLLRLDLTCDPSYEGLAERTGLLRSSVGDAVKYLCDVGIVEKIRGATRNTYRIRVENLEDVLSQKHRPAGTDSDHRPVGTGLWCF